jgi:hydroxymethylpyrimidine kinase/phosphomethylpyrimidine kinase/thiamine-phosphate diphosphorylase
MAGYGIRTDRYDSERTHGTGCTLSSAIVLCTCSWSVSSSNCDTRCRRIASMKTTRDGATSAMQPIDACCLGKAYVAAGIARAVQLGQGPGPSGSHRVSLLFSFYPRIASNPALRIIRYQTLSIHVHTPRCVVVQSEPKINQCWVEFFPIVDTVEWVEATHADSRYYRHSIAYRVRWTRVGFWSASQICQKLCAAANIRLWINDYWEAAVTAKCFGVHLGQEDLLKCKNAGGLDRLQAANLALGISTHSYGELAAALAAKPTYISLGPIFGTTSKKVAFDPQGLHICRKWRQLCAQEYAVGCYRWHQQCRDCQVGQRSRS